MHATNTHNSANNAPHRSSASSTSSTASSAPTTKSSRFRWRTVDIVVASVVGVASGVIFWAWGLAWVPLSAALAFSPGLAGLLGGGWLFAGILGALIIRKPGAALYTELIAAIVSSILGSMWGFDALLSGVLQGLGAEIIFATFLYRNWSLVTAILAGIGASLGMSLHDLTISYPGIDGGFVVAYIISGAISGAVIAGVLPWLAVKGLARAGALTRFPAGSGSRTK